MYSEPLRTACTNGSEMQKENQSAGDKNRYLLQQPKTPNRSGSPSPRKSTQKSG